MNFFRKLFGSKPPPSAVPPPVTSPASAAATGATDPAADPNLLRIFDTYGREMYVPKEAWRKDVLPGNLKSAWDDAEKLAKLIVISLQDGFAADLVDAARQLQRIDPYPERGAVLLSIAYLHTNRIAEAERALKAFIDGYGERGVVLAQLARVYAQRGEPARSDSTLWRALELDPNQDNALLWFAASGRQRDGERGYLDALRRAAGLPGSWRAKLWLARHALEQKDLAGALPLYHQILEQAAPVPHDTLVQISGDLGNHGHVPLIVELVAPRFRAAEHGITVGGNLIRAYLELNQPAEARQILESLYVLQRPDWRQTLDSLQREIDDRLHHFGAMSPNARLQFDLLPLEGVVWARRKENLVRLLPVKSPVAARIGIVAPSVTFPPERRREQVQATREDREGMFSRATALYLAEQLHLRTTARGIAIFTQVTGRSGFVLAGGAYASATVLQMAGEGADRCHLIVNAHIDATVCEWTITLTALRVADGEPVQTLTAVCEPERCASALTTLAQGLVELACRETSAVRQIPPAWYGPIPTDRWLFALFARSQVLLLMSAALHKGDEPALYGERAIIDGLLHYAVDQKSDPIPRLLLVTALFRHRETGSAIYREYADRVRQLQREYPVFGAPAGPLADAIETLYPKRTDA